MAINGEAQGKYLKLAKVQKNKHRPLMQVVIKRKSENSQRKSSLLLRLGERLVPAKRKSSAKKKDSRLARAKVSGFNKPKRTPGHKKKSHIVVAKVGTKVKTIRFGQQGAKTAGKPKAGESEAMKKKRAAFKARHAKNIAKGKMSAAYWADKVKW